MTSMDTAILDDLEQHFPGLVDGDTEVNGADLVEHLTMLLRQRIRGDQ